MNAQDRLARLRVEDPAAAAAVVEALWAELARTEPKMFHALWRRANLPSRRKAPVERHVPKVQWLDELPPLDAVAERLPAVNLMPDRDVWPQPEPAPVLVFQPSPTLADLLPSAHAAAG